MLGFLLEHAPLERWERDVLAVIRDEAYYFVPQMQTKIMNEGWASYWHSQDHDREGARRVRRSSTTPITTRACWPPRRGGSTRTSSASSCTATSRSAGTRASSAASGKSATTSTPSSSWDLRLGPRPPEDLRGARALQRRDLHRRVPDARVLSRPQAVHLRLVEPQRALRDRDAASSSR